MCGMGGGDRMQPKDGEVTLVVGGILPFFHERRRQKCCVNLSTLQHLIQLTGKYFFFYNDSLILFKLEPV